MNTLSPVVAFSEKLKELREQAKLSQEELGKALGYSRGSISYYEQRQRVPDVVFLERASRYFNVSSDWFLGITNVKSPDTDMQAVCKYTGLTEKAVNALAEGAADTDAANFILEQSDIGALSAIGQYLRYKPVSRPLLINQNGEVKYFLGQSSEEIESLINSPENPFNLVITADMGKVVNKVLADDIFRHLDILRAIYQDEKRS